MSGHSHTHSHHGGCSDGCDTCPIASAGSAKDAPYKGGRFALLAMGYFIIPIVSAMTGAHYLSSTKNLGALGAVSGLILGMGVCVFLSRTFFKAPTTHQENCK